jgi:hypothetical protein
MTVRLQQDAARNFQAKGPRGLLVDVQNQLRRLLNVDVSSPI